MPSSSASSTAFRRRLGRGDLVPDDEQRHLRLDQQLRGALDLGGVGPYAHARIDFVLGDDLGVGLLVVEVGVPGDVARALRRRPRRLEAAAHGLRDHIGPPREPGVLGHRLHDLLLVGDLLEAVAARAAALVGAVAVEDQRRLLLVGVEHLPHGVHHAHDRGLHDDRGLARGLDVAGCHRRARPSCGVRMYLSCGRSTSAS